MKRLAIIVILGFQYFNSYSQQPLFYPQTHEIGIQYGSIHHIPELSDYYDSTPFTANFVNGLQYKFHWDLNNVFRISASTRSTDIDIPDGIERFSNYSAQKEDWDVRLGYEANLPVGPWLLFIGAEGIYGRGNVVDEGLLENNDTFNGEYKYRNLGVGGFGGIRLFLHKNISTSLEANLYYTDIKYDTPGNDIFLLQPNDEWGLVVRGYVTFHFVKLKKRCACQ